MDYSRLNASCSAPVSSSGHSAMACWLDLPDPVARLYAGEHRAAVCLQSWLAPGATQPLPPQSKNQRQGAHVSERPAWPYLVDSNAAGCGAISLVACASFPSDRRRYYPGRLHASRDPDLSGKRVPGEHGTCPARTGANGDLHWSLSLYAPSALYQRASLLSRNALAAWIVVWLAVCADPYSRIGGADPSGGARAA